jgi:UDPglucose 6-dehydrogenase
MNLSVIGTGYVGLVTGACLAGSGNNVICVDIDETKVKSLKKGHVPFYERSKRYGKELTKALHFTTDTASIRTPLSFSSWSGPPNHDGSANMDRPERRRSIGSTGRLKIIVTRYGFSQDR